MGSMHSLSSTHLFTPRHSSPRPGRSSPAPAVQGSSSYSSLESPAGPVRGARGAQVWRGRGATLFSRAADGLRSLDAAEHLHAERGRVGSLQAHFTTHITTHHSTKPLSPQQPAATNNMARDVVVIVQADDNVTAASFSEPAAASRRLWALPSLLHGSDARHGTSPHQLPREPHHTTPHGGKGEAIRTIRLSLAYYALQTPSFQLVESLVTRSMVSGEAGAGCGQG